MVRLPSQRGPRAFPPPLKGRVTLETVESRVLQGNPWGDPTSRTTAVYTPPSGRTEGIPLLLLLAGFTGAGWMGFQRPPYLAEPMPQRFERLVRSGSCGEAVIVAPDCLTTIGGSQYVNSTATGRYQDHVLQEVLPWAQEKYRTRGVGVLGQSSGGFGALHLALERPDLVQAAGSSSGDVAFEYSYLPDIPKAVRVFRQHGGPEGFLTKLFDDPSIMRGPTDPAGSALNMLAMAACYSPLDQDPGSFQLPFDAQTGALLPAVWERWLQFDPLRRVATDAGAAALKRLRLLHITASAPDEWALDVGARMFVQAAEQARVPVVHQEFEGGHFQSGPRFEALLTRMVSALTAA